jgi:hypothetical protein
MRVLSRENVCPPAMMEMMLTPNPALNRTGRYVLSCLSASARPAG